MSKEAYLIVLSGQGDTEIKIVDKETFDWINSKCPVFKRGQYGIEEKVPPSQIAARKRAYGRFDVDFETCYVTSGSYDNDRALCCQTILEYSEVSSIKAAMAQIKKKGHKLANEYHGNIY